LLEINIRRREEVIVDKEVEEGVVTGAEVSRSDKAMRRNMEASFCYAKKKIVTQYRN
jgi:hypothetical protein